MDDIDDVIGALGLVYERIRRFFFALVFLVTGVASIAASVLLARVHPPIALATCVLLFVTLLYRAATSPSHDSLRSI